MERSKKASPCQGVRSNGQPCNTPVLRDGWCWAHHPDLSEQRKAARSKGGRNRANAARLGKMVPSRLLPVVERLERAMEEVESGNMDPRAAAALAGLAQAIIKAVAAGELEERLRALEAAQPAAADRRAQ